MKCNLEKNILATAYRQKCEEMPIERNTGKSFRQKPKCRLRRNKNTTFWHKSDDCILAAAPSNSLLLCLANFDLNMEIFWGLTSYNLFPKSYFLWNFFLQHAEYKNIGILIQKRKEKAFLWTKWIGNGCDTNILKIHIYWNSSPKTKKRPFCEHNE